MKTTTIVETIEKLKQVGYVVLHTPTKHSITCSFVANFRTMTFKLIYMNDNTVEGYFISVPTYQYTNKLSHFRYSSHSETRSPYSKAIIRSLIKKLQKCGVWDYILNSETFVEVNTDSYSASLKTETLSTELTTLISGKKK